MTFDLGSGVKCDTARLIDTRLLVQANSGGGKSWALRRVLEQTHGQAQHLVIDPEGEFATLRERFDYVLAARSGGDTLADPRSAGLLAERLLELGVSAVIDIYELKAHDRVRFVRYFLEALVDAPKKLWHPAFVVVDEAHVYCPQQGEAESASAVIDLATRGRKRGFCAILATQRLSKLHKDAAAELNNKLIGRTGLDVDVKRAADELGFAKERWRELRELPEGEFFTFGPAISREVRAVHVGPVTTTHPKAGARLTSAPPAPSAKVRAVLAKLSDLPAEAEKRERTMEDLQAEVNRLRREAASGPAPVAVEPERVEVEVVTPQTVTEAARVVEVAGDLMDEFKKLVEEFRTEATTIRDGLDRVTSARERPVYVAPIREPAARAAAAPRAPSAGLDNAGQRVLDTVAMLNHRGLDVNRESVARWLAIHPNGGRYGSTLAQLREDDYLDGFTLTAKGAKAARVGATGVEAAMAALPDETKRRTLAEIIKARTKLSRETLAERLGIHPNGGRYGSDLAWLRTMGAIPERGAIEATPGLFR